jgi:hypothetical protein
MICRIANSENWPEAALCGRVKFWLGRCPL